jgi:hypothetical protein
VAKVTMKVTQSGVIVSHIGAIVLGLVVASAVALGVGRLWPVMQLPVFCVALLCWVIVGIAVMLRDRGKREINPVSWLEGREYAAFSRTNTVLINVATILFGFVLASLAAGLAGLLWTEARWPVFFVLVGVWVVGGVVVAVLRDVFDIDIRDKIW